LNYCKLTNGENNKVWGRKQSPKKAAVNDLAASRHFRKRYMATGLDGSFGNRRTAPPIAEYLARMQVEGKI
jgi:hypothetical protein